MSHESDSAGVSSSSMTRLSEKSVRATRNASPEVFTWLRVGICELFSFSITDVALGQAHVLYIFDRLRSSHVHGEMTFTTAEAEFRQRTIKRCRYISQESQDPWSWYSSKISGRRNTRRRIARSLLPSCLQSLACPPRQKFVPRLSLPHFFFLCTVTIQMHGEKCSRVS